MAAAAAGAVAAGVGVVAGTITLAAFIARVAHKISHQRNRAILVVNNDTDDNQEPFSLAHITTENLLGDKEASVVEGPPSRLRPGEGDGILVQCEHHHGDMHVKIYYDVVWKNEKTGWSILLEVKIDGGGLVHRGECQILRAVFCRGFKTFEAHDGVVMVGKHQLELHEVNTYKKGGKHTRHTNIKGIEVAIELAFREHLCS